MIISPKEARDQGLVRYFTGKPCKHGHVAERHVVNGDCVRCARLRFLRIQSARREEFNARQTKWRQENPEHVKADWKKRYAKDRGRYLAQSKLWATLNPEKRKQVRSEWKKRNADRVAADQALRRSSKRQATPAWVDRDALRERYAESRLLTESGVPHHVDHIIPLLHPDVCGLHVPWNLQVITAAENYSKNNRVAL